MNSSELAPDAQEILFGSLISNTYSVLAGKCLAGLPIRVRTLFATKSVEPTLSDVISVSS